MKAAPEKPAKTSAKKAAKAAPEKPAKAGKAGKKAAKAAKPGKAEKPAKTSAKKAAKTGAMQSATDAAAKKATKSTAVKSAKARATQKPAKTRKQSATGESDDMAGETAAKGGRFGAFVDQGAGKKRGKASKAKPEKAAKAGRKGALEDASKAYSDSPYVEGGGAKVARASKQRSRPSGALASAVGAYTGDAGGDDDDDDDDDMGGDDDLGGGDDDDDGLAEPSSHQGGAGTRAKRAKATSAGSKRTIAKEANDGGAATRRTLPAAGDRAPAFELAGDDGNTWSLERLAGERFVLYFYPRDDTPGCTREACDFRDRHARFEEAGVRVFGVSSDTLASHGKFRGKYQLPFVLLSDPDREVASAYGVVGEKSMYGRKTIGVIRSTFVIGPDGRIEHVVSPVRVDGHADAILSAVAA